MLGWLISILGVSLLIPFGIGVSTNDGADRVFFFGMNPNTLGFYCNIALAFLTD